MQARALQSTAANQAFESTPVELNTSPYLFADSEPYAYEFDCISALSGLVDLAAVVLAEARAEKEIRAVTDAASNHFTEQLTRLAALERETARFAPEILLGERHDDASLLSVSSELSEAVRNLCGNARERLGADLRRHRQEADTRIAQRHETARAAVQRFLLGYELGVTSECFHLSLSPRGYAVQLTQVLSGGIEVDYRAREANTAFCAPRHLSDLTGALRLPVGHKRALLSQTRVLDLRALGDHFLTRLRLEGDVMELELRKRRDAPEALQLQLVRYNDGVTGQVRGEDPNDTFDVPLDHASKLVSAFHALRSACTLSRDTLDQVTNVRIDGVNALDGNGPERLLDRLVVLFEPIVSQLTAHGAATSELSLKRDLGDGRREERFISLAHLVDKVSSLSREDRTRLSGLGLDRDYRRSESGSISLRRADSKEG